MSHLTESVFSHSLSSRPSHCIRLGSAFSTQCRRTGRKARSLVYDVLVHAQLMIKRNNVLQHGKFSSIPRMKIKAPPKTQSILLYLSKSYGKVFCNVNLNMIMIPSFVPSNFQEIVLKKIVLH